MSKFAAIRYEPGELFPRPEPAYPVAGGSIGQWLQVNVADGEYLSHWSIVVDPANIEKVEKYVVVVYEEPNASARYWRGESLYSFDEAFKRAAGLMRGGLVTTEEY